MYIPINGLELTHLMRFCKILIQGAGEQTRRYFSLWKAKFMSLKIKHSFVKKLFISSNFKLKWFYILHYYISIHVSVLCVDFFACINIYVQYMNIWCLWTIEKNNWSSWIEVIDDCEVPRGCWELNTRSLKEPRYFVC